MQFVRQEALYRQIANHFGERIQTGQLKPGEKLPATPALAKEFNVTIDTIQQSLKLLVDCGMISRVPKQGTFVRQSYHGNTIGIVLGGKVFGDPNLAFFANLLGDLVEQFEALERKCRVFVMTQDSEADPAMLALKQAVATGELIGVIYFCETPATLAYLDKVCPLPIADPVYVDMAQMTRDALRHLRARGFATVDVLTLNQNHYLQPVLNGRVGIQEHLRLGSPPLNIRLHPVDWGFAGGYAKLKELWASPQRPVALFVDNDTVFRGVWYATMELGIRIPAELSLITHLNHECASFTHLKPNAMVLHVKDFADKTVASLLAKLSGRPLSDKLFVSAVYQPGETCR